MFGACDRVKVPVVGADGVTQMELHLLGRRITGSLQGLEALHALTKVRCACYLLYVLISMWFHIAARLGTADKSTQRIMAAGTRVRLHFVGVFAFLRSVRVIVPCDSWTPHTSNARAHVPLMPLARSAMSRTCCSSSSGCSSSLITRTSTSTSNGGSRSSSCRASRTSDRSCGGTY